MTAQSDILKMTEGVVASFDSGIGAVGLLIEKGLEILDGYRMEQEAVRGSLRESLATVTSLRRKDFDGVMEQVLTFQAQRETEIKTLIKGFLGKQRDLAKKLKRALEAEIFQEVERIKNELSGMIEEARGEILSFQKEQDLIKKALAYLEAKKNEITAHEFKRIIQELEEELLGPRAPSADERVAVGLN